MKYQIDWLVRMQASDGGVYVKMGSIDYGGAKSKRYYGPECTGAVSYTHLDVYKRQLVSGGFNRPAAAYECR